MDINLDGGEKAVLKAIGIGGSGISGKTLLERVTGMEDAELIDTIRGLMTIGYLISDKQSIHEVADIEHAEFNINSGYSRELKEALDPGGRREAPQRSRRVRRE